MQVAFPYGEREVAIDIPDEKLTGVFVPKEKPGVADLRAELARALGDPIESPRLRDIAQGKRSAVIVVDDVTRDVPSREILPPVLDELGAGGVAPGDVTVLVATGLHRPLSGPELDAIRGGLAVRIENHDARGASGLVSAGHTSLGQEIRINRTFMAADLKVLTGDVEYHQFCGYGGGAKSVYPGLADVESITHNHSMMEVEGTGPGRIDGNPVRSEIDEVGRMAGVDFVLNVVQNSRHEVVRAYAGDMLAVLRQGAEVVDEMYRVEAPRASDLVITSAGGFPRDIDLYQSQKAVTVGRRIVKKGGAVVTLAECRGGHGSDLFDEWMTEAEGLDEIFERIRKKFVMGGHKAYQFAREIRWAEVHLLSALPPDKVSDWFMHPLAGGEDIATLIRRAESVAAVPQGVITLTELRENGE